jgi:hypothetical protein
MNNNQYILSFTGASLSMTESITIAEVYLRLGNWPDVKSEVKKKNLIQARTKSSISREYQELQPRLAQLTQMQLELLVEGNPKEQKKLLWLAICKRYEYIQEFASEVVHEKFLKMDFQLTAYDYDSFYNHKADWHPELDGLTDTTREKMKTRIFRMLTEAEIITPNYQIIPITFTERLKEALASDREICIQIFPISTF